jgi:hypothetical protein
MKPRLAALVLCLIAVAVPAAAQPMLAELMTRHGVRLPGNSYEAAFDAGAAPLIPLTAGSFAAPLAMLTSGAAGERIAAAYAFGILAGRSGRAATAAESAAAGQAFLLMIASADRPSRIAGARVAGRVFAAPFENPAAAAAGAVPTPPVGLAGALFAMWNQSNETEQLAAMDGLGLIREASAVSALNERYYYYRNARRRALAGGALEAMARIGHPSSVEIIKLVAADPWAGGTDATALAVTFARERVLRDGSVAVIRQALADKRRRDQARGYLGELGVPVP